jgi:effector-binding domain-containing protein
MSEPFAAEIRDLVAQPTVCLRVSITKKQLGDAFGRHAGAVFGAVGAAGAVPAGPLYGRYFSFTDETVDVEIGVPVASPAPGLPAAASATPGEVGIGELPAGRAAVTVHYGHYHEMPETYRKLHMWIAAQGLTPGEGPWESYVDDPGDMKDMSGVRTDVVWPVG